MKSLKISNFLIAYESSVVGQLVVNTLKQTQHYRFSLFFPVSEFLVARVNYKFQMFKDSYEFICLFNLTWQTGVV
jgi:hypothetical protein